MKLEQSFTVEAPVEHVWAALIDVERIAPCLPGAEITGVDDAGAYQGTFSVKLGPTTASYRGTLRMEAADEAARTATMSAKGTDKRGQGGASATIVSTMREEGGATHVDVLTDFHITGRLARFGRSGMIEDISRRLMRDFADCLQATIVAEGPAGGAVAGAAGGAGGAAPAEPDPADAAVASAGGAAAEAATAGAAPPGADKLAEGPAAPAPAQPASPPPLVGRPVERPAADDPAAGAEPAGTEQARTGWLSDWPDGGVEELAPGGAAAPGRPAARPAAGDSSSAPAETPPGSEPPVAPFPEPVAPEPPAPAPPGPHAADSSSAPVTDPPAPAAPPPASVPSSSGGPPPPQPVSPPGEAAAGAAAADDPAVRTESIPPPHWQERPAAKPAKPISGFSLFFSVLGERIRRLFSRRKKAE